MRQRPGHVRTGYAANCRVLPVGIGSHDSRVYRFSRPVRCRRGLSLRQQTCEHVRPARQLQSRIVGCEEHRANGGNLGRSLSQTLIFALANLLSQRFTKDTDRWYLKMPRWTAIAILIVEGAGSPTITWDGSLLLSKGCFANIIALLLCLQFRISFVETH